MATHDPIDSLIYLNRTGLVDFVIDQLSDSENDVDPDYLIDALTTFKREVRKELNLHHDGRKRFSTGVPFERVERYATSEPGENGQEEPVIGEAHVQFHPDGSPHESVIPGGLFVVDDGGNA